MDMTRRELLRLAGWLGFAPFFAGDLACTTDERTGDEVAGLATPEELAAAVLFLAEQGVRGATHELQVTPLAERWVP